MRSFSRLKSAAAPVAAGIALAIAALGAAHAADKKIPAPPYYYVLDEPGVLGPQATQALETLLIEHDRLTGEQVVVAIFKSLDGEDLVDYTNRVFGEWKIGQKDKDNGALLALYWNEHQSRIEVGYGLEGLLTDAKSKLILTNILTPELKNGNPDRAISLATLEILRTLGSPLIQNGKAAEILRGGGFTGGFVPTAPPQQNQRTGAWPWLVFGLILMSLALNFFNSAEAHFTSGGSHSPDPLDYYQIRGNGIGAMNSPMGGAASGFTAGMLAGTFINILGNVLGGLGGFGGGGGGGGFGGFMGGGGSSGGGGASGSW